MCPRKRVLLLGMAVKTYYIEILWIAEIRQSHLPQNEYIPPIYQSPARHHCGQYSERKDLVKLIGGSFGFIR